MTRFHVTAGDLLDLLSSEAQAASPLGGMLESLRNGVTVHADPSVRRERTEMALLQRAAVIRCLDALASYKSLRFVPATHVRRLAESLEMADGAVCVAVLRKFMPWASSLPESGLAAVHVWLSGMGQAPSLELEGGTSVAEAFKRGKAKRARAAALAIVADSQEAIGAWVEVWNRGRGKAREGAAA